MQKLKNLLSGLIHIVTGLICTVVVLYAQNWFGQGDIWSYLNWTIPLAIGISVIGIKILRLIPTENRILRVAGIFMVSIIFSFAWFWFIFLILGPWIHAFSIPVFYLWTIGMFIQLLYLDWRLPKVEKQNSIKKNIIGLLLFIPVVLGTIFVVSGLSYLKSYFTRPMAETYLIPENFVGQFRVVYGQECGTMPEVKNGRRILEIPKNGILIIQPEFEAGIIDHEYYLEDNNGNRKMISQYGSIGTSKENEVIVKPTASGYIQGRVNLESDSEYRIAYADFEVFNNTTTKAEPKSWNTMDSLTFELVETCRNRK